MAAIHQTSLDPGKLDLLAEWLPLQRWYVGSEPTLAKAGGFRLDDPAGAVGIEFMIVRDQRDNGSIVYCVPMTYRDAPLMGADSALIGCAEHGVLGRRWVYDAEHDPVFAEAVIALLNGTTRAQHQDVSNTVDPTVTLSQQLDDPVVGYRIIRRPRSVFVSVPDRVVVGLPLPGQFSHVYVLEGDAKNG